METSEPKTLVIGRCHICVVDGIEWRVPIKWCSICQHWFCKNCRKKWWDRTAEAIREKIGGRKQGCCGPVEE